MSDDAKDEELLGDKVEKAINAVGGAQVAKAISAVARRPCNCGKRKAALNEWHKKQKELREQKKLEAEQKREKRELARSEARKRKLNRLNKG